MKKIVLTACAFVLTPAVALADPCGMVPPISLDGGPSVPIRRVGLQKTYMYFNRGVETIVLRPGFTGDIDNFGMLIPFPSVPEIRKVPDEIFGHVAKAIDPPEIKVWVRRPMPIPKPSAAYGAKPRRRSMKKKSLEYDTVKVVKQEAVGMYQVAVLEAGSAQALKKWMDEHGYRYPTGMDEAANDYVDQGWCFVAVKTRVGQQAGANPRPGMRKAKTKLPKGATFSGHVQAMGFRFRVKEPVIPMRLSTFNEGELRNVVYLLTSSPNRIDGLPKYFVKRQLNGRKLFTNITNSLPLRIYGGSVRDFFKFGNQGRGYRHRKRRRRPPRFPGTESFSDIIGARSWSQLTKQRNPRPYNGLARELFAGDLLASRTKKLTHPHEEREKAYLDIGERLGLRGPANSKMIENVLKSERSEILTGALRGITRLTMTVIDGDFPRDYLRDNNLKLARYRMEKSANKPSVYHAGRHGPHSPGGIRYEGRIPRK